MTQTQLYRDVAHVTGESVDRIRQIGFGLLAPINDPPDEADRWLRRRGRRARYRRRHSRRFAAA